MICIGKTKSTSERGLLLGKNDTKECSHVHTKQSFFLKSVAKRSDKQIYFYGFIFQKP